MWCCTCVNNVKVTNELGFCFGALDDLWRWWAKWGALVENFEEWACDRKNNRQI